MVACGPCHLSALRIPVELRGRGSGLSCSDARQGSCDLLRSVLGALSSSVRYAPLVGSSSHHLLTLEVVDTTFVACLSGLSINSHSYFVDSGDRVQFVCRAEWIVQLVENSRETNTTPLSIVYTSPYRFLTDCRFLTDRLPLLPPAHSFRSQTSRGGGQSGSSCPVPVPMSRSMDYL